MVFELFTSRMGHWMRTKHFVHYRLRRYIGDVEKDEKKLQALERQFPQLIADGFVNHVDSSLFERAKESEHGENRVFQLEERTIIWLYDEFMGFYEELRKFEDMEGHVQKYYGHFSPPTQQRVHNALEKIAKILGKDADETLDILLQFARVFRDQYNALLDTADGHEAQERLRDMIIGAGFEKFRERWSMGKSARDARRMDGDIDRGEKAVQEIEQLLAKLANGRESMNENALVKELAKLEKIVDAEEEHIESFLHDVRFYLLLVVKHYFEMLGHILKITQDEQALAQKQFPKEHLQKLLGVSEIELKRLQKTGQGIMHQGYQLYHKMQALESQAKRVAHAA